jgi:hypothetical protein
MSFSNFDVDMDGDVDLKDAVGIIFPENKTDMANLYYLFLVQLLVFFTLIIAPNKTVYNTLSVLMKQGYAFACGGLVLYTLFEQCNALFNIDKHTQQLRAQRNFYLCLLNIVLLIANYQIVTLVNRTAVYIALAKEQAKGLDAQLDSKPATTTTRTGPGVSTRSAARARAAENKEA